MAAQVFDSIDDLLKNSSAPWRGPADKAATHPHELQGGGHTDNYNFNQLVGFHDKAQHRNYAQSTKKMVSVVEGSGRDV